MKFFRALHPTTRGGLVLLGFVALGYAAVYLFPVFGEAGVDASTWLMTFAIPASWALGPVAVLMILLGTFAPKDSDPFRDS